MAKHPEDAFHMTEDWEMVWHFAYNGFSFLLKSGSAVSEWDSKCGACSAETISGDNLGLRISSLPPFLSLLIQQTHFECPLCAWCSLVVGIAWWSLLWSRGYRLGRHKQGSVWQMYSWRALGKMVFSAWRDRCHLKKQVALSDCLRGGPVSPQRCALTWISKAIKLVNKHRPLGHRPLGHRPPVFLVAIYVSQGSTPSPFVGRFASLLPLETLFCP